MSQAEKFFSKPPTMWSTQDEDGNFPERNEAYRRRVPVNRLSREYLRHNPREEVVCVKLSGIAFYNSVAVHGLSGGGRIEVSLVGDESGNRFRVDPDNLISHDEYLERMESMACLVTPSPLESVSES